MKKYKVELCVVLVLLCCWAIAHATLDAPVITECHVTLPVPSIAGRNIDCTFPLVTGATSYVMYVNGQEMVENGGQAAISAYSGGYERGVQYAIQIAGKAAGVVGPLSATVYKTMPTPVPPATLSVLVAPTDFTDFAIPYNKASLEASMEAIRLRYVADFDGSPAYTFTVLDWRDKGVDLASLGTYTVNTDDGTLNGLVDEAFTAAQPLWPEAANYDIVLWVMNGVSELGFTAGKNCKLSAQHSISPDVVMHEMGHSLGFPDAGGKSVFTGEPPFWYPIYPVAWERYGNSTEYMGANTDYYNPSLSYDAWDKYDIGLIAPSKVLISKNTVTVLQPSEDPSASGTLMIKVPIENSAFYIVEYKKVPNALKVTTHIPPTAGFTLGTLSVKDVTRGLLATYLPFGGTWYDRFRGIGVRYEKKQGNTAVVRIWTLGPGSSSQKSKYVDTGYANP